MNTTTKTNDSITLSIDGMSCEHCVQAVTKALSAVPGVQVRSVAVGSAAIKTTDASAAEKAALALEEAGYPARVTVGAPLTALKTSGGCCGGAGEASAAAKLSVRPTGGCCG